MTSRADPNRLWLTARLTAIAIVVASCGAGTTDSSGPTTSAAGPLDQDAPATDLIPDPGANPSTIEYVLDESAAVTSTIGADGGELVTMSNGIEVKLVIPADALDRPTEITMTPLDHAESDLVDLTMGGAQFAPSGLLLAHPAILELTGATVPSELMAVRWNESGGEIVPTVAAPPDAGRIRIPIAHFSGAGAGTPGPDASTASPWPNASRAEQTLAEEFRNRGPDYPCIEADSPAGVTAVNYYIAAAREDVIPALKRAQSDDLVLLDASRKVLDWWAIPDHLQALSDVFACGDLVSAFTEHRDGFADEIGIRLTAGFTHAIYEAARQCKARKDAGEVQNMIKFHERAMFVLAIGSIGTPQYWEQQLTSAVEACATYRVELRTQLTLNAGDAGRLRGTIAAVASDVLEQRTADLLGYRDDHRFPFDEPSYRVELPHNSDSCVYEDRSKLSPMAGSNLELTYRPPERKIPGLNYQEAPDEPQDGDKKKPDGRLVIDELETTGSIVVHCDDKTYAVPLMSHLFPMWFNGAHKYKSDPPLPDSLEFFLTRTGNGTPAASFTTTEPIVDPTDPSSKVLQDTEVKVFHTPQDPGPEPPPPPDVFP